MVPTVSALQLILQRYGTNAWYEPNPDNSQSSEMLTDLSAFITEIVNLDSGHFGYVWKASCTAPGLPTIVAVKKLKPRKDSFDHFQFSKDSYKDSF